MLLLLLALCNSILSLWPATQWLVGRGDNSKCRQNYRLVLPTLAYIVSQGSTFFLFTAYTRGIAWCFATMYTLMYFGLACANISFRFGVLILDFVFLSNTFVVTVVKVWWWLYIWTNRMWQLFLLKLLVIALINNALLTHDNMLFNNMLSNFLCSIFLHIKLLELEDGVNVCFIFSGWSGWKSKGFSSWTFQADKSGYKWGFAE